MPFLPPQPPAQVVLLRGADLWLDRGAGVSVVQGQAVVVKGDRILAVGEEGKLRKAHPKARVVELRGGTLLPGLIEGHAHVAGLGRLKIQVNLAGAESLPECLGRIRAWSEKNDKGWILGRGWDQNRWPRAAYPTAADLDRLTGTRPAFLRRVDGHAAWVNSAALAMAGIDAATKDPEGGALLRDASGNPTGILVDKAMDLAERLLPEFDGASVESALLAGLQDLRGHGFTGVCDMGTTGPELEALRRLQAAGTLPIRVFSYLAHDEGLIQREMKAPRPRALGFLQVQGVKFYLDGALGSRGARLLAPYADAPGSQGLWVTEPETVARGVEFTLRSGYQPAVHAIGDAANHAALDLMEKALGKAKGLLVRPRIEHAQIVTDKDAARFGRLGVVASVQPVHCTSDHAWTPARLGPERLHEAFPWRKFLDGKALLAFGSDAPVEDPAPFVSLAAAESREDPEGDPPGGFLPDQRVSREEALRAYTWGNARALGRSDLGIIQPGAAADLVWVDAPLQTLSLPQLRALKASRVWVAGKETERP